MKPHLTFLAFVVLVSLWCAGIVAAPVLHADHGFGGNVSTALYSFFARVCHQIDQRSFHLEGEKLAVCARCSSLYLAFWLSLLAYPLTVGLRRQGAPARHWLLLAVVPMLVDVSLNLFGVHGSTLLTRAVSGAILGAVLPPYVVPALLDAVQRLPALSFSHPES